MGNWSFRTLLLLAHCFAVFLVLPVNAQAATRTLELSEGDTRWPVEADQLWLSDIIGEDVKIEDILAGRYNDAFRQADKAVPVIKGYGKTVWARLQLHNPQDEPLEFGLVAKFAVMDRIDWYMQMVNGGLLHKTNGNLVASDPSVLPSRFPRLDFTMKSGETRDIYIRIRSDTHIILPLRVYTSAHLQRADTIDTLIHALLIGSLIAVAAMGFVFFAGSRNWSFFWFALCSASSAFHITMSSGLAKAYLWPTQTFDIMFLWFFFQGLAMGSTALFVSTFLNAQEQVPRYDLILKITAGFSFLTCLSTPLPMGFTSILFLVSTGIGPFVIFGGAIWLWRRGLPGAGLMIISWLPNQAGIIWTYLRGMDLVPYSDLHHYTIPVTCTLTAIAFTWALHRQNMETQHRATHDQLTGLPNRFQFEQLVSRTTPYRRRSRGLMQIDLDGFKAINDNHGHAAGDAVLTAVAGRLQNFKYAGVAFRTGGDEFVMLCRRELDPDKVTALAEQIIEAISRPVQWRGKEMRVGASIGLAYPVEGRDGILDALEEADNALYDAKRNGKGQVVRSSSFPESTTGMEDSIDSSAKRTEPSNPLLDFTTNIKKFRIWILAGESNEVH